MGALRLETPWIYHFQASNNPSLHTVTNLGLEEPVHPQRVLAAVGLGKALLWHHSVLLDEVDDHVPLTSVAGGVVEQERHQPPVRSLAGLSFRHLDDGVEEVVAALHLFIWIKYYKSKTLNISGI